MSESVTRRDVAAWLMIAGLAIGSAMTSLALARDHLPSRIPLFPILGSHGDDYSPNGLVGFAMSMALVVPAVLAFLRWQDDDPALESVSLWEAWFTPSNLAWLVSWCLAADTALLGSWGAGSLQEAQSRWWTTLVLFLASASAPAVFGIAFRRDLFIDRSGPLPESSIALGPSERAYWAGTANSTPRLVIGLIILALGGVLFLVWGPLILISLIGFLVARSSRISVILDYRGLAWRRRWGRHSARIKLDAISAAKLAVHETAWQAFRDWARDGTDEDVSSIRLRPGQAILVRLGEGREVSISLDQADEAADVLNALIVRHRTAKDPTLTSQ